MEDTPQQTKKPLPWRLILFLVVGILLIFGIWYGSYLLSTTNDKLREAERVSNRARQYEVLSENIEEEQRRCQEFIAQEQGQFGEFQYCQRFIEWVSQSSPSVENPQ